MQQNLSRILIGKFVYFIELQDKHRKQNIKMYNIYYTYL